MEEEDNIELEDLILQSARLNVRLRKKLRAEQQDPEARYFFTYVLLLQNGNIYVGSTNSLYMRLYEHLHETDMSSQWVRLHGPVIRVLEISRNSKKDDEVYKTLEYMSLFGWQSVRGAHWCKVELKASPPALHDFQRDRSDFRYLSRQEIDAAIAISKGLDSP